MCVSTCCPWASLSAHLTRERSITGIAAGNRVQCRIMCHGALPYIKLCALLCGLVFTAHTVVGGSSAVRTTIVTVAPIKAKGSGPLYRIRENGKWGYMNRQGDVVIPVRFDRAEDFFEQKAVVSLEGKAGYIDEAGKWHIEPTFFGARRFQRGIAVAKHSDTLGIIDTSGRFLIDPQFAQIEDFSEGLAAVWRGPTERRQGEFVIVFGGKWGFIKEDGSIAIETHFERVKKFTEGLAATAFGLQFDPGGVIVNGGKWGFIDTRGRIVIPPKFDEVKPFYSGVAVYWDAGAQAQGLIDHSGSVILPAHYRQIGAYLDDDPFRDGLASSVAKSGLVEYLKATGRVAFQCPKSSCSDFSEGLARVSDGRRSGYIDTTGAIVITLDFDDARDFSDDLAAAKEKKLWGYINKTGRWAIPPRFTEAHPFVDGLALVRLEDRWIYIDGTGGIVRENVWDGLN
jgi:hypothetical protein